ncbi:NADH-flavin reductase [Spiroplasma sp. SV19]|uniref:NAD(P)-dependent oxidoreductase n=1 Tax=Spiroplasma sp. SV19 TaxID=2570468 RepID=UPI0024B6A67D|nr:NADH-flavin reductase [Spiroplasma sp. SV19]WHQ36602.1 NADH-flavin reductase [Spiroplasma sp. SV19]
MKILLVGAQGKLGQKLINELNNHNNVIITELTGNAKDFNNLKTQAVGQDVLVSTVGAHSVEELVLIAKNMITIASENQQRIVWSGGAGSLWTNEHTRLIDIPIDDFPVELAAWKPAVYGHYEVLKLLQSSSIAWSYLSPALDFEDIPPRGLYQAKSSDSALYNSSGDSFASYLSGAKALTNEIINPQYLQQRFTIVEDY